MHFDHEYAIDAPGGTIWTAIRRGNAGRTPLLLVHGGPGANHLYLSNFSEHIRDRDLIYYDQLDSGFSARPGDVSQWTLERACRELECVIECHGLDRFHLLGSSWGGSIAAAYASQQDERLASVVLAGPLINAADWNADNRLHLQKLPSPWSEILLAGQPDHPQFEKALSVFNRQHMLRLDEQPNFLKASEQLLNQAMYRHMWGPTDFLGNGTLAELDLLPALERIECPTHFIVGEHDECSPAAMRRYIRHLKAGSGHVIANASHLAHIEQPVRFFALLEELLAGYEASTATTCAPPTTAQGG